MFCSKCGKTLKPDADICPYCGASVGDSRFEGNGYTAAQPRFSSGASAGDAAPYTRTTYTSMDQDDESQGDIYSRTTYRPVLKDAENKKPEEPDEEPLEPLAAPQNTFAPDGYGKPKAEEPADDSSVVIAPLKPIKKTGISPEVQQYIRRMNEQKVKKSKAAERVETGDEALDNLAAESAGADVALVADAVAPRRARIASSARSLPSWAMPAGVVACILVILGVAVYALMMNFAGGSQLEGVGYDLRKAGIDMIKTRETTAYRAELAQMFVKDYSSNPPGTTMQERLDADKAAIQALLPLENQGRMKNDELFVDTLVSIQESVATAAFAESLAQYNRTDPNAQTALAQAQAMWDEIGNAISRLEGIKEASELRGIESDVVQSVAEPTPEPTPEPDKYKTLTRDMMNNKNVGKMQKKLKELGWFNGKVDSDFGNATIIALKKFQEAAVAAGYGIRTDGVADSPTQELLYSDEAPATKGKNKVTLPSASPTLSAGAPDPTPDPNAAVGDVSNDPATAPDGT